MKVMSSPATVSAIYTSIHSYIILKVITPPLHLLQMTRTKLTMLSTLTRPNTASPI